MRFLLEVAAVALQASVVYGQYSRRRHSPSTTPNKTVITYHLFEPKYTGLADKDAGDFLGDAAFIFLTFNPFEAGNPEASIQDNIIEMSTVTVEGWSREYLKCNAPGAIYNSSRGKQMDCPSNSIHYCCEGNTTEVTADTLPGYESQNGGYWFSFPGASEGKKWTEKVQRRIKGSCIGNAWREEAGGCPQCGADLDQCVAQCIESALVTSSGYGKKDYTKLHPVWDKAFSNKTFCPDQPFPSEVISSWPPSPSTPPNTTVTTYHLFEPKYTGLADKDAGDFLGDASFIFMTFNPFEAGNPEASIQDNIIEMSTVTVEGWSREYLKCNAPGAVYNSSRGEQLDCPSSNTHYCCEGNRTEVTADTLPGYESRNGGYWFSFPAASEGRKWTEKVNRRIKGSCLGNAWREEAGGCPQCGADLDQCVAQCIESALVTSSGSGHWGKKDYTKLHPVWDKAFSNKTMCPDQPLPGNAITIIV